MEATFKAYDRMMEILDEVARTHNVGSNVVLVMVTKRTDFRD